MNVDIHLLRLKFIYILQGLRLLTPGFLQDTPYTKHPHRQLNNQLTGSNYSISPLASSTPCDIFFVRPSHLYLLLSNKFPLFLSCTVLVQLAAFLHATWSFIFNHLLFKSFSLHLRLSLTFQQPTRIKKYLLAVY